MSRHDDNSKPVLFGVILVGLGLLWLLSNLGILSINLWDLWPVGLIIWGLYVVYGALKS